MTWKMLKLLIMAVVCLTAATPSRAQEAEAATVEVTGTDVEVTGPAPGVLRQDHSRIGGEVAVRGIARRLDGDGFAIGVGRQPPVTDELVENAVKKRGETGVKAQFRSPAM